MEAKAIGVKSSKKIPPAVGILVLMVIVFSFVADHYLTLGNFTSILSQASPLMILALGQTLVVLTQNTDLSLGSLISMVTVAWILLLQKGIPMPVSIVLVLAASSFAGLLNGLLVGYLNMPGFIATIGMQYVLKTVALVLCNGSSVYFEHPLIQYLSRGMILGLPVGAYIALAGFAITFILLYRTKFGNFIFAVGGNKESLVLAGGNYRSVIVWVYVFAGFMGGVSGILVAGRVQSGNPIVGIGWEFNSLSAVLLGGTSLRDGKGGIVGTFFGVMMIQVLKSGLISAGIPSIMQNAIIGLVVLAAIVLEAISANKLEE